MFNSLLRQTVFTQRHVQWTTGMPYLMLLFILCVLILLRIDLISFPWINLVDSIIRYLYIWRCHVCLYFSFSGAMKQPFFNNVKVMMWWLCQQTWPNMQICPCLVTDQNWLSRVRYLFCVSAACYSGTVTHGLSWVNHLTNIFVLEIWKP